VAPDDFAQIAVATGAMLVGRRTWDVGDRMEADEPGSLVYVLPMRAGDGIPFSSPCPARVDLEPISSKRREPSPSSATASLSSDRLAARRSLHG
jgi:hypothetical protein